MRPKHAWYIRRGFLFPRQFGRIEININIYLIILWVETIFTHQLSYNEHPALTSRFVCIKIIDTSGLFTLKVPDSNSNSDCKPNGYIVIYRIFSCCIQSDSDSHPNCRLQEWDWNRIGIKVCLSECK